MQRKFDAPRINFGKPGCPRTSAGPSLCTDGFRLLARQVYTLVEQLLLHQTSLLYGRHLDQVLLAAVYGVCKVNSLKQVRLSMRPLLVGEFVQEPTQHHFKAGHCFLK